MPTKAIGCSWVFDISVFTIVYREIIMLSIIAIPFSIPSPVAMKISIPFAVQNPSMSYFSMVPINAIDIYREFVPKHRRCTSLVLIPKAKVLLHI